MGYLGDEQMRWLTISSDEPLSALRRLTMTLRPKRVEEANRSCDEKRPSFTSRCTNQEFKLLGLACAGENGASRSKAVAHRACCPGLWANHKERSTIMLISSWFP